MRITFLSFPTDLTGGQRVIAVYAQRLEARGHHVEIVCCQRPRATILQSAKNMLRRCKLLNGQASVSSHYDNYGVNYRIATHPGELVEQDISDGDIVIATWWETAEWVANLPASKGVKLYFVQHHEVFRPLPADRSAATYRLPLKKICVANWLRDVMQEEYADDSCFVVPNTVESEQFFPPTVRTRIQPTVGFVFSRSHFKGSDICVEAIRIAKERMPTLRALAFGIRHPVDKSILRTIDEFHLSPRQTKLRELYGKCDAWLFGSRSEGFGLPILEAMACGTPVIGTPAGASADLLSQGGGLLVNAEDPQDMARAIVRVATMPATEWQAMSDAAFRTATAYTWDDATALFERALLAAVGNQWAAHCRQQRCAPIKPFPPEEFSKSPELEFALENGHNGGIAGQPKGIM